MTIQIDQYNTYTPTIQSHLEISHLGSLDAWNQWRTGRDAKLWKSHGFLHVKSCLAVCSFYKIIEDLSWNQFCQPNSLGRTTSPNKNYPTKPSESSQDESHIFAELLLDHSFFSVHLDLNQLSISWMGKLSNNCPLFYPEKKSDTAQNGENWYLWPKCYYKYLVWENRRLFLVSSLLLPGDAVENRICKAATRNCLPSCTFNMRLARKKKT